MLLKSLKVTSPWKKFVKLIGNIVAPVFVTLRRHQEECEEKNCSTALFQGNLI